MENYTRLTVGKEYQLSKEVKAVFEGTVILDGVGKLSFKPTTDPGLYNLNDEGSILFSDYMERTFMLGQELFEILKGMEGENGKQ